jgi:hypothetical protein
MNDESNGREKVVADAIFTLKKDFPFEEEGKVAISSYKYAYDLVHIRLNDSTLEAHDLEALYQQEANVFRALAFLLSEQRERNAKANAEAEQIQEKAKQRRATFFKLREDQDEVRAYNAAFAHLKSARQQQKPLPQPKPSSTDTPRSSASHQANPLPPALTTIGKYAVPVNRENEEDTVRTETSRNSNSQTGARESDQTNTGTSIPPPDSMLIKPLTPQQPPARPLDRGSSSVKRSLFWSGKK